MITILNISDTKFSYNGIAYFKNFTPFVTGNKVSIVNTYDACISLTNFPTIYSDISVDGVTYGSVAALQNALLPVLFNRTFTQAGSLTAGYIPKANGSNILGNSAIYQDANGSVGIGISPPNYSTSTRRVLDINGVSQSMLALSVGGIGKGFLFHTGTDLLLSNEGNGAIKFNTNGSQKLIIEAGGNVLINNSDSRLYGGDNAGRFIIGNPSVTTYLAMYGNSHATFPHLAQFVVNSLPVLNMTSSGNVGIGTTSPAYKLDVVGAIRLSSGGVGGVLQFDYNSAVGSSRSWRLWNDVNANGDFVISQSTTQTGSTYTDRLYINASGNVGIGTTSPSEKLTLSNGKLALTTDDVTIGGKIYGYNDSSVNLYSGGLKFQTRYFDGSNYVYTDRLTLNSSGSVGIGTTSPSYTLHVNGSVAGTSAYVNLSDKRHKKDILPIENALDKILALNGVTFNWDKKSTDMNLDDNNHIGLIAQDVEKIIPQAVVTAQDENETKSVAYTDLVPVLIEAIKELKAEIEILKN